jgi:hypothetical protein
MELLKLFAPTKVHEICSPVVVGEALQGCHDEAIDGVYVAVPSERPSPSPSPAPSVRKPNSMYGTRCLPVFTQSG